MTRDALESLSVRELIELILQHETQLAQLDARVRELEVQLSSLAQPSNATRSSEPEVKSLPTPAMVSDPVLKAGLFQSPLTRLIKERSILSGIGTTPPKDTGNSRTLRQRFINAARGAFVLVVKRLGKNAATPAMASAPVLIRQTEQPQASPERAGQLRRRIEWLILCLVVLAAFLIRVYNLDRFPDTVLADEADNAQSAVRILYNQPPANGFFGFDWTSQPAFSVYKEAAFIAIFGFNIMAMRLPSAVISALTLIPFYLLLRRQLSAVASLLATILLATDVWYLNFSRSGWNCIDICFYMLMAMLFLVLALNTMTSANGPRWLKWGHFAMAGFFCALGLYGYPSGRAITLAVAAFFPIALLFNRKHWKTLLLGYLLLFTVEAVAFAPEGVYVARNWDLFNGRSNVVLIFNSPAYKADPVGTMLHQLDWNIRGPWDGHVNNTPQYSPVGEPQLDQVTSLLTLLGMPLTLALGRLRGRPETWLWWLMLLAGWSLTQLLTVGTPNGARGIGYMPTLVYFAGVSLDGIVRLLTYIAARIFTKSSWVQIARQIPVAALTAAIFIAGYANVTHYVDWQNKPHTREERYLYVTAREFPDWSATIVGLARNKGGALNVGSWRDAHPIQDRANPYGTSP